MHPNEYDQTNPTDALQDLRICKDAGVEGAGPEFGPELQGRKALIVRALYGTKSAGADFRNHLRDCMEVLGYQSCQADADLWMRKAVKGTGERYYEYVLLYVDDCLCISEHPKEAIEKIDKYFPMKPGSIAPPALYLGAKISKVQLPNGVTAWAQSTSQYVQEAIKNVEEHLARKGMKLFKGASSPILANYAPELDTLDSRNGTSRYCCGGINVVLACCHAERGPPTTAIPHICFP